MIQDKKIRVIINPNAGMGLKLPKFLCKILRIPYQYRLTTEELETLIREELQGQCETLDIIRTDYAGHAKDLSLEAVEKDYYLIISVGGDGTANEVVNGIVNTNVKMCVVPFGSANLLSKELLYPDDIKRICNLVKNHRSDKVDTASVNDRHFVMMASIGFDSHVVSKVNKKEKSRWGLLAYPLIALREIWRYPFRQVEIKTDDGMILKAYWVFVQNTKTYASGYKLTPTSSIQDGVMEVVLLPKKSIFSFMVYLFSKNKPKYCAEITNVKALTLQTTHKIQVDGDYAFRGPAKITVNPKSLHIISEEQQNAK